MITRGRFCIEIDEFSHVNLLLNTNYNRDTPEILTFDINSHSETDIQYSFSSDPSDLCRKETNSPPNEMVIRLFIGTTAPRQDEVDFSSDSSKACE